MRRTLGDSVILLALAVVAFGYDRRQRVHDSAAVSPEAPNVILVVSDGLRWQEVMRGADSLLLFDNAAVTGGHAGVRRRFWRPTVAERREALMPFVWKTLAREGQVLGNRDLRSRASVTNGKNFSYPGYNEMLVGYPDARIESNDHGPNPNVTVFEWLNRRSDLHGRVGAIGAWHTFADIFNRERSNLYVHAFRQEPLDARAHAAAVQFLTQQQPRALFVAYVETDDMAHNGRYDLLLETVHRVDAYLAALWSAAQALPQYRGRTTLIFTTDHGRGRTIRDWTDHGPEVDGADEIWVAIMGPDTPARGEVRRAAVTESQVAATVASALGLDYRRDTPAAARPMADVVNR